MSPKPSCPAVREILDRVGDKWSLQVIAKLGERRARFTELRTSIEGISQRMLTLTLRGLERDGLVARIAHVTIPPYAEYALTELGRSLLGTIRSLVEWAEENRTTIQNARVRYERRQAQAKQPRKASR